MRSRRLNKSAGLTLVQGGAGVGESGSASTTYGCERVDGITLHKIRSHQLSVSLNDLERQVEMLESRYLEVCDMLITATDRLVRLSPITTEEDTTK